jgi:hypothetical protein
VFARLATSRSRSASSINSFCAIRASDAESCARNRSPTRRPPETTSRRPPVSATMQGQPNAIASSATSPNGS